MSHTFADDKLGVRAHYNGDFSGDIEFVVSNEQVDEAIMSDTTKSAVRIPASFILELVGHYLLGQLTSVLQSVEPLKLLAKLDKLASR